MKILVTGGAGFIGSHIVDLLINNGHRVVVVDNLRTGKKENLHPQAMFYHVDITSKKLAEIFEKEKPDAVCHQAAQANARLAVEDPAEDARLNILGSINLFEQCAKYKVKKIVYASSVARFGEPKNAVDETHSVDPLSQYGVSKFAVEKYLHVYKHLYGVDYTILIYSNVYGPRQDPKGEGGVVAVFMENLLHNKICTLYGDGEQTRDFVYVKDVAAANFLALTKQTSAKTFVIGTGKTISVNKLFETMKTVVGKGAKKHVAAKAADIKHMKTNPARATKELGWKPEYSLEDGMKETVSFFK